MPGRVQEQTYWSALKLLSKLRRNRKPRSQPQGGSDGIPREEWIVGAMGLLLTIGVIGFLLYHALGGNRLPPDVKLRIDSIVQTSNGYVVEIRAVNEGESAAAGVIIEGALKKGAEQIERSQTTIDYLPSKSEKKAGLFFTQDPRHLQLNLRPLGYSEP